MGYQQQQRNRRAYIYEKYRSYGANKYNRTRLGCPALRTFRHGMNIRRFSHATINSGRVEYFCDVPMRSDVKMGILVRVLSSFKRAKGLHSIPYSAVFRSRSKVL